MKAVIHYSVKLKFIRRKKEDGEFEFLEVNEEFYNDNPILARKAAFKYYQNYIDVLLEARGLKYKSDKQAREALESFYDPKTATTRHVNGKSINLPDSWGNGIAVFLVLDEQNEDTPLGNNRLIHGIGHLWEGSVEPESLTLSLEEEYSIYKDKNYATGNNETSIIFCNSDEWLEGYRDDEPQAYTILRTPFDWTGMDKPYWWGEPTETDKEEQKQPSAKSRSFEEIIANGETNTSEFKPSLLYNFKTKNAGIGVKAIIGKSICGLLNARGGFVFIGVKDDGTPQGLSYDFSLSGEKNPRDYFRLEFDDMIKQFLPESIKDKITGEFVTVNEIEIFVVFVFPSKSRPVFLNGQHGKEFWVRWTASTRQYIDIEEITTYCLEHWNNKEQ